MKAFSTSTTAMDATTTVIDTRTYEVTGTIEMDAGAHEIVVI